MKIYTKKGDGGETSLFTGQKVPKNDAVIEALGTVDECNSAIGVAISLMPDDTKYHSMREQLEIIQHALFDLGAALATPRTQAANSKVEKTRFDKEVVDLLEKWIDAMSDALPKLTAFILPGGHPAGAALHLARSICRRAERTVVPLHLRADVSDKVMMYLNRLSDYLFMASRHLNHLANCSETKWKPHLVKDYLF
ncbi:MAG TPA: cob(I)yrinic acid a,c-diamide adenosyltransferase [Waddliaceae bacterium]